MLWFLLLSISLTALLPSPSFCSLLERFEDLKKSDFDFVVIGGGAAGNTIANRLTENPNHHVLVLEAGGTNENVLLSMVPDFCGYNLGTANDWKYTAQIAWSTPVVQKKIGTDMPM
ncbi:hypothetical protein L218DRAFT_1074587 [Marasmius fiardii PR-910]|nr:hypothetical protein L218DRAFT_1074587 [Marasmius fiardii PR-910]